MGREPEISIGERCDIALQKNREYMKLQSELATAHENNNIDAFSELSYRMERIAIISCYKLAIRDMYKIISENGE